MLRRISSAAAVLAAMLVAACGGATPEEFAKTEPRLILEDYFAGQTRAHGIFEDRFGQLRRRFKVEIDGNWNSESQVLTLDERFQYADGETDRRVWKIQKKNQHHYEGMASDVIGPAKGESYGSVFNWGYKVDLKVGESIWRVHFDDWLYRVDKNVVINRAEVTRWGIEIGTVTIVFRKSAPDASSSRESTEAATIDESLRFGMQLR